MNGFFISLLGGFLGAFLGVIGSKLAFFILEPGIALERKRDDALNDILDEIEKVRILSVDYWSGAFSEGSRKIRSAEQDLRTGLHNLIKESSILFEDSQDARVRCEGEIRRLRILITGRDFGDGQVIYKPEIVEEIKRESADLRRFLRTERGSLKRRFL
jgi:hypothetical protein